MLLNNKFMYYTLMQAKIGFKKKNLPVGSIIISKEKILSSKYNIKIKSKIFEHAEVRIIDTIKKNIKNLSSLKIYTTLEPCSNCLNIIQYNRLKYLQFIIFNKYLFTSKILDRYKNCLSKGKIEMFEDYFLRERKI